MYPVYYLPIVLTISIGLTQEFEGLGYCTMNTDITIRAIVTTLLLCKACRFQAMKLLDV